MIRLLPLLLAACTTATASQPPPANLVCSRLALAAPDAECTPELTTPDMHRARVTLSGATVACALPSNALTVVCGPLFPVEQQAPRGPQTGGAQ